MLPRFFFKCSHFEVGQIIVFEHGEQHHLQRVLRLHDGDRIQIVNGCGELATATLISSTAGSCHVDSVVKASALPECCIAMPLLRPGHLDFAVEKLTEVGVTKILLFSADKSERSQLTASLERRLMSLMTAAMKQSGQLTMPQLVYVTSLQKALDQTSTPKLWADIQPGATPLQDVLGTLSPEAGVTLFIGPESGWSDHEKTVLGATARCAILHHNVLRAETAAVVSAYLCSLFLSTKKQA